MLLILPWIQSLHQTRGDSGIHYDLKVDTSSGSPAELAQTLASQIAALS